jgi:hypothetical protein
MTGMALLTAWATMVGSREFVRLTVPAQNHPVASALTMDTGPM